MITGLFVGLVAAALLLASAWDDHRKKTASKEPQP